MRNVKLAVQRQQLGDTPATEKPNRSRLSDVGSDVLGLAGLTSLGYGLYQVSEPAAFIVIGAIVFILALLAARA